MPILLMLGGVAKRVGTTVITWLSSLTLWQLVSLGLAIFAVVQHFQLADARHDRDAWKQQYTRLHDQLDRADAEARKSADQIKRISKELKDRTDEDNRRIAGDANSLRVSGPGKAACRPAPAASGNDKGGSKPDASGPPLPPDERAAVPWGWLTDRAEEHDQLRAEAQAWHDWYAALVRNWPK